MKSTGIIRRMDELGRVVVPIEIRNQFNIAEKDPIEIYVEGEKIVLKYYYVHTSGKVIEKHIDVISGQILANAEHTGNEGDSYDIPSRTFEGYDLVEDRLPTKEQ